MTTPRKHAELIKAWADDSEMQIEMLTDNNRWITAKPDWEPDIEYRIKPKKLRIGNVEIEAPFTEFKPGDIVKNRVTRKFAVMCSTNHHTGECVVQDENGNLVNSFLVCWKY